MIVKGIVLTVALALVSGLHSQAAQVPAPYGQAAGNGQPPAKFRSKVDVVSVSAVVRDRKGRFVPGLVQKDFMVAEAGQVRPIIDFRAESDGPVKLAVLFDVSGSMRIGTKAVDARQAARHLFGALRPADAAAVFAFDTRLQRVRDFTTDMASLTAALDKVDPPYGQTSLYDAVAETARAVSNQGNGEGRLPQRSAVVLLTDGVDTRSRLTPEQVSGIASEIDVPIYVIAVVAAIDDPRSTSEINPQSEAGALLNLARWTGGDLFTASAPAHASVAARQIVDELRHQYVIAFEASPTPGWRPLELRARDGALTVRARAGYIAGGQS